MMCLPVKNLFERKPGGYLCLKTNTPVPLVLPMYLNSNLFPTPLNLPFIRGEASEVDFPPPYQGGDRGGWLQTIYKSVIKLAVKLTYYISPIPPTAVERKCKMGLL